MSGDGLVEFTLAYRKLRLALRAIGWEEFYSQVHLKWYDVHALNECSMPCIIVRKILLINVPSLYDALTRC